MRAAELDVESMAFPALGTGVGGFGADQSADAMIGECVAFVKKGKAPSLKRILFVLFSEDVFTAFAKQLHGRD
jgi:O-acetyl-ADP-ribose deacetylase (regulator of RNase III)